MITTAGCLVAKVAADKLADYMDLCPDAIVNDLLDLSGGHIYDFIHMKKLVIEECNFIAGPAGQLCRDEHFGLRFGVIKCNNEISIFRVYESFDDKDLIAGTLEDYTLRRLCYSQDMHLAQKLENDLIRRVKCGEQDKNGIFFIPIDNSHTLNEQLQLNGAFLSIAGIAYILDVLNYTGDYLVEESLTKEDFHTRCHHAETTKTNFPTRQNASDYIRIRFAETLLDTPMDMIEKIVFDTEKETEIAFRYPGGYHAVSWKITKRA